MEPGGGGDVGLERIGLAVKRGEVSAVELVRRSLERIDRLDRELNAVVALRAERALEEAAALDRRVAAGQPTGRLAGAPLLVKDIEDVAGMPTTFGSLLFKDAPPATRDGLVPERLRAAGAIVVGKTNLPELAAEGYTANRLFGATCSPWAPEWSPGGSSGGSGAALAAGMGPLATSIEDLRLLLALEAGPVAGDPTALPTGWPPAGRDDRPARPDPLAEPGRLARPGRVLAAPEHAHKLGRATIEAATELLHPNARSFLEAGLATPVEGYLAARRRRFEYVRELDELLGDDGVIVTPTLACAGWLPDGTMPGSHEPGVTDRVYNTMVANVTGHPSLSLPAGRFPSGVPFGLQVTGPRFRDDLVLDVGEAWERARPWPPAAPGYEPFDVA